MKQKSIYLNFIKEKGRPLSDINPGSDEFVLTVDDALFALKLLDESRVAILGGDILSQKDNGRLVYAYQLWGDGQECHCLNWSCDKMDNESEEDYTKRSYMVAKEKIKVANKIANDLNKKCYIVFII